MAVAIFHLKRVLLNVIKFIAAFEANDEFPIRRANHFCASHGGGVFCVGKLLALHGGNFAAVFFFPDPCIEALPDGFFVPPPAKT